MDTLLAVITSATDVWADFSLRALTEGSVGFALILAVWLLVRRRATAQLVYLLFAVALAKLVLPATWTAPQWLTWMSPLQWFGIVEAPPMTVLEVHPEVATLGPEPVGGAIAGSSLGHGDVERGLVPAAGQAGLAPLGWLFVAWFGVVTALATRFLEQQRVLMGVVRRARPATLPVDVESLRRDAGVRRRVRFLETSAVDTPAAGGWFRPYVLVPQGLAPKLTPGALRWVLLHELAHIRRGDIVVAGVQRVVQILLFFHPLVWIANRLLDEQREFACDEAALRAARGVRRKECGAGFLSVVEWARSCEVRGAVPTVAMFDEKSAIRRRLMRILNQPDRSGRLGNWMRGVAVLGAAFFVLPDATAAAGEAPLDAETVQDPERREAEIVRLRRQLDKLRREQEALRAELEAMQSRRSSQPGAGTPRSRTRWSESVEVGSGSGGRPGATAPRWGTARRAAPDAVEVEEVEVEGGTVRRLIRGDAYAPKSGSGPTGPRIYSIGGKAPKANVDSQGRIKTRVYAPGAGGRYEIVEEIEVEPIEVGEIEVGEIEVEAIEIEPGMVIRRGGKRRPGGGLFGVSPERRAHERAHEHAHEHAEVHVEAHAHSDEGHGSSSKRNSKASISINGKNFTIQGLPEGAHFRVEGDRIQVLDKKGRVIQELDSADEAPEVRVRSGRKPSVRSAPKPHEHGRTMRVRSSGSGSPAPKAESGRARSSGGRASSSRRSTSGRTSAGPSLFGADGGRMSVAGPSAPRPLSTGAAGVGTPGPSAPKPTLRGLLGPSSPRAVGPGPSGPSKLGPPAPAPTRLPQAEPPRAESPPAADPVRRARRGRA